MMKLTITISGKLLDTKTKNEFDYKLMFLQDRGFALQSMLGDSNNAFATLSKDVDATSDLHIEVMRREVCAELDNHITALRPFYTVDKLDTQTVEQVPDLSLEEIERIKGYPQAEF